MACRRSGWTQTKKLAEGQPERPGASARMQYVVTGGPDGDIKYYWVLENGKLQESQLGELPDAEVTLTQSYDDALKIQKGELDANAAFMQGRIKVTGNMAKLMSLLPLTNAPEYKALQDRDPGRHRVLVGAGVRGSVRRRGRTLSASTPMHEPAVAQLLPRMGLGLGRRGRLRLRGRVRVLGLGLALVSVGGACGGGGAGSGEAEVGTVVRVHVFAFHPDPLRVKAGALVTWRNDDDLAHTVTSGTRTYEPGDTGKVVSVQKDGLFAATLDGPGKRTSFTFSAPGTFHYFCEIHPGMESEVIVS